jgi:hypothetical protein
VAAGATQKHPRGGKGECKSDEWAIQCNHEASSGIVGVECAVAVVV